VGSILIAAAWLFFTGDPIRQKIPDARDMSAQVRPDAEAAAHEKMLSHPGQAKPEGHGTPGKKNTLAGQ